MQPNAYDTEKNKKEWVTIALHVLIWLIVFLIPYIFSVEIDRDRPKIINDRRGFLYLVTVLNFFWVVLFYVNSGLLFPRLVYRKKVVFYILVLVALFCVMVLVDVIFFSIFIRNYGFSIYRSINHNFIPFVIVLAVSSAYKSLSDKNKADIVIREKQSEHLKTELSFLRSQISPHFLFNVMNNIVALVRLKSDQLEPTVIKLSSLMQYMLYETDEEKVVLKSEIDYLQNYIDLQQQRFGSSLLLSVDFDVKEDWHTIEPMLLIPFVENAFKHVNGLLAAPEIEIHLLVDLNQLHFKVLNKFKSDHEIKDKTSGIGLVNVKRRLELLYPGTHQLFIEQQGDWFSVYLQLTLK